MLKDINNYACKALSYIPTYELTACCSLPSAGERPFECETCHKRFTRNEELTRHTRIHTGDRPFGCELCGKRFGRKDHLNKHQRTHAAPLLASAGLPAALATSPIHVAMTSQMRTAVTSQMHAVLAPYPFGYGAHPRKLFQ